MSDKETAEELDEVRPILSFEELVEKKMKQKKMSRKEAIEDILRTATKTNKTIDELFDI